MANKPKKAVGQVPRWIQRLVKTTAFVSPSLAIVIAARLFTTPVRYKRPKREQQMNTLATKEIITVPSINKQILVYHYGQYDPKILLVHGWSGRGTQLVKFANRLKSSGFSTVSFDAPAHGKSSGKTTMMPEFIESIMEIDRKFGPFYAAAGHSLGGMSLLNAVKDGLKLNCLITIGSGDIVGDIMNDFIRKIGLHPKYSQMLSTHFERKTNLSMDSYSAYRAAGKIEIPTLVIHDQNDLEVPVECAFNIHKHLKNGQLLITSDLGHRKILGDQNVIEATMEFLKNNKL